MTPPKIFIATPMYGGQCHGVYVQSLLVLSDLCRQLGWTCLVSMLFNESLITRGRNAMVHNFMKTDCTHLFFIDSDIKFTAQEVPRMVEMDKDVICGIYPKKEINWWQVREAIKAGSPDEEIKHNTGSFVVNLVDYQGSKEVPMMEPVEIWNGGTGFMLIKREVLEKMSPLIPHYKNDTGDLSGNLKPGEDIAEFFTTSIEPGTERLLSEDYHFCHTWRTLCQGKIWAAPWVTLAHCGSYLFEGQMTRSVNTQAVASGAAQIDTARGGSAPFNERTPMTPKKHHPHGLPHLSDATSDTEILAGSQAWSQAVANGDYTFIVAEEHAIDEDTDLLLVVRKKIKR